MACALAPSLKHRSPKIGCVQKVPQHLRCSRWSDLLARHRVVDAKHDPDLKGTSCVQNKLASVVVAGGYAWARYRQRKHNSYASAGRRKLALRGQRGVSAADEPKPNLITDNFSEAARLSLKFQTADHGFTERKVVVIGGGLAGLSCAKYLSDAGFKPVVLERRPYLGGKVSAWQDADGDWIETGLHVFFGAYPNMMNLFSELMIDDRLQWKKHAMIFAMQQFPGKFTRFELPPLPAPLHFAYAILTNQDMMTLPDKLQTAPALLPMLVQGQDFIDAQDELSVTEFMQKYKMPDSILEEIFLPMAKALDFADPDRLSMGVILTAMNRFLNEPKGSQIAFLDGNATERLCRPLKEHIEKRGGKVVTGRALRRIHVGETGEVTGLELQDGEKITADEYVLAVPVDILKRLLPQEWRQIPYFSQMAELRGIPVINLQLWFDRKLQQAENHLVFSRSPLLSVYADMSICCREYSDPHRSMLELVFAPCDGTGGSDVNWLKKEDDEIISATMQELERLFPTEIAADGSRARLIKYAVVRTPRSVYAATPGRRKFRPSQDSPIPNLTLAGDWTAQKFLGSMEGAVLSGKLAAKVILDREINKQAPVYNGTPAGAHSGHLPGAFTDENFEEEMDLNGAESSSCTV